MLLFGHLKFANLYQKGVYNRMNYQKEKELFEESLN